MGDERTEFDEVSLEVFRLDPPELELAQAWGVHDVAATLESDQLGTGGRMFALESPVGNLAHAEVQPGLDCVQERALADPALSRDGRRARGQKRLEPSDAQTRGRRCEQGLI